MRFSAAIVGSGPAGFNAAEALLQSNLPVQADVTDRLPVSFGLVRHRIAAERLLDSLRRQSQELIDFAGWRQIDVHERRATAARAKPREKFKTISAMIKAAASQTAPTDNNTKLVDALEDLNGVKEHARSCRPNFVASGSTVDWSGYVRPHRRHLRHGCQRTRPIRAQARFYRSTGTDVFALARIGDSGRSRVSFTRPSH